MYGNRKVSLPQCPCRFNQSLSLFAQLFVNSYLSDISVSGFWPLGKSFLRNEHLSVSRQCLHRFKQQSRGIDWLFHFLPNFLHKPSKPSYLALFSSFLSPPIPSRYLIIVGHILGVFHRTTHSLEKSTKYGIFEEYRGGRMEITNQICALA